MLIFVYYCLFGISVLTLYLEKYLLSFAVGALSGFSSYGTSASLNAILSKEYGKLP